MVDRRRSSAEPDTSIAVVGVGSASRGSGGRGSAWRESAWRGSGGRGSGGRGSGRRGPAAPARRWLSDGCRASARRGIRAEGLSLSDSAITLSWLIRELTPINMGPPTTVIAHDMTNDWQRAESPTAEPDAIATTPAPVIKIPKTSRIKDILAPTQSQNTPVESPQAYGY